MRDPIRLLPVMLVALASVAQLPLGCAPSTPTLVAPASAARCPSGYFEGKAVSAQEGEFDFALNLRCGQATYEGDILTANGTFLILHGSLRGSRLELAFGSGADTGTIDAEIGGARVSGSAVLSGLMISVDLSRVGEARPPPHLELTTEQWREDLRFLARELPKRHKNAFHFITRESFDTEVAALERRLPELDDDGAFVGLSRIASLVGDGHTSVRSPPDPPMFPIDIRRFGDEYRVIAVGKGSERILGARVVLINQKPVAQVRELLWPLTPADETLDFREARIDELLKNGILLHGLGILSDRNAVSYTLTDDSGATFAFDLRAVPPGERVPWVWAFEETPLHGQRPDEPFWFTSLPAKQAIYCSFRGYQDLGAHAQELMRALDEQRPQKLILDMRMNRGGDYTEGLKHIIEPLRQRPSINKKGHLFVLIGPKTFSAAMSNAAQLRARTAATLVGQPIGEKPNSYQEPRAVKLPRSGLVLRYSTRFYSFIEAGENVIRPDREIVPSWPDFKAGRDPVLEWALDTRSE